MGVEMKLQRGVTIMEVVIVITVTAILASAFSSVMVPMMNLYFYFPESSRVNNAAVDLLDILIEGDKNARGLRFAGQPCAIPIGGSSTITTATASTLTYYYSLSENCGTDGFSFNSVDLVYDSDAHIVTRSINGGPAEAIPYYATSDSGIHFDPPDSTDFFRYYDAAGTELLANQTDAERVDITVTATSGSGRVEHDAGQISLKSGVEIKRYTA